MRYGLVADIHGNLEAFSAVLKELDKEKVAQVICVGDIVGYGADPRACLNKIKNLSILSVAGNHDWAAVKKTDVDYFNTHAKEAVLWTERQLKKDDAAFLKDLPLLIEKENFQLVHASLVNPSEWRYVFNFYDAKSNFTLMKKSLLFIGHSHVPVMFFMSKGRIGYSMRSHLKIKDEVKYIINVGSVGQPRDGDPRACYVIYNDAKKEIIYKRTAYSVEKAQSKIRKAGLPEIEAARLSDGR